MALYNQYEYEPKDPAEAFPSLLGALQSTGQPEAAPARPSGVMGYLSDPRVRSMLTGMSKAFFEAGAPTMGGTSNMRVLGMGLSGGAQGIDDYAKQQAAQVAEAFNRRIKEAELRKANAEAAKLEGTGDPFGSAFGDSAEGLQLANYARQMHRQGGGDPQVYIDAVTQWKLNQSGQQIVAVPEGGRVDQVNRNPLPMLPNAGGSGINLPPPTGTTLLQRDNERPARDDQNWVRQTTFDLRKEYDTNNLKLADYSSKLSQAEQLLNSNQSGTTDVAIVNTFQKLIDEGAVVREADVQLLSSTGGAFGTLKQMFGDLRAGEKLPPEVRTQMLETIRVLKNQFDHRRNTLANDYRQRAIDFELDPDKIAKPPKEVPPYEPDVLGDIRRRREAVR